ncbi:hypothetical protein [Halalkalibacter flavus]|uniref:hypothetical protein n=1 Tax=Halalkalibacter flavus TaxID=3090668 RepID=UPI002FC6849C
MPLESLLEFIAQNFIFVAVIVGGLISMLGRMTGAGQQHQDNRGAGQRQRPPQQPQEEKVDWREIFKQEEMEPERGRNRQEPKVEQVQVTVPSEREQLQQEIQNRYDELRQKREKASQRDREVRSETEVTHHSDGLDLGLNRLSNKEAMKAVVWSEVLGRPRARQPHNTFSRRRYMK